MDDVNIIVYFIMMRVRFKRSLFSFPIGPDGAVVTA